MLKSQFLHSHDPNHLAHTLHLQILPTARSHFG